MPADSPAFPHDGGPGSDGMSTRLWVATTLLAGMANRPLHAHDDDYMIKLAIERADKLIKRVEAA